MTSAAASNLASQRASLADDLAPIFAAVWSDTSRENVVPAEFRAPLQYTLEAQGKLVRPLLVRCAFTTLRPDDATEIVNYPACAVELLHNYSLIHDDLPAMDNDDLRRGRPTLHKAYDDATAILVGDSLQAKAFSLLADAPLLTSDQRLGMIRSLAQAAGASGMVGGQYLDIRATGEPIAVAELQTLHQLKTGALIQASLEIGGIAGKASEAQLAALRRYGEHIGLAFQVVDDILDVRGDRATLGKTPGKDDMANKATYVSLLGLDGARAEVKRLLEASLASLADLRTAAPLLEELARYITSRDR